MRNVATDSVRVCDAGDTPAECVTAGTSDRERDSDQRIVVIGLGNPLVSDDSVGLRVAQKLRQKLVDWPGVEVVEDYWGGLQLMEQMIGYDRAVVIDAICTDAPPGTIHHLNTGSIATQKSASAHDVNLATALEFGRRAGAHLPPDERVHLVAIEAADVLTFNDRCTPAVAAAIPCAVTQVVRLLQNCQEAK